MKSNARVGLWCAACGAPAGRAKGRRTRAHREAAARALVRAAEAASIPGGAAVNVGRMCTWCGREPKEHRSAELKRECKSMQNRLKYEATRGSKVGCKECGAPVGIGPGGPIVCASDECIERARVRRKESERAAALRQKFRRRQRRPMNSSGWGSYGPLTIFNRDGWRCRYCACEVSRDVPPQAPNRASIDHVVPLNGETVSGLDVIFNVVTACRACNSAKSNRLDFKKEAS